MVANDRCLVCGLPLSGATAGAYHAKCAKSLFGSEQAPTFAYSAAELNELAKKLVLSRVSVPGVQPKLSVHLERSVGRSDRLTLVGLDGGYILKLPAASYPELPEGEHFAMTLARLCGIETAAFGLVRLESGALAYLTRRMDREDGIKHMVDFCQLTDRRTSRKYYGSYEQIAKTMRRYATAAGSDVLRFFDVLLFSFLIGNSDMHLKNFSLISRAPGHYVLSQAYDLVNVHLVFPEDNEELALTLDGRKKHINKQNFVRAMASSGLGDKVMENIFRKFMDAAPKWYNFIDDSFLPAELKERYKEEIRANLGMLQ